MNLIQQENKNAGTSDWQIKAPGQAREIEGFASDTSVKAGEVLKFYIQCKASSYRIDFFRMGWYEGMGGRLIHSVPEVHSVLQPEREINELHKVECNWNVSYELVIPGSWCTGVYLAKLSSLNGIGESYIIFTVRTATEQTSTFLFQLSTNTYQAYNNWGNFSLYEALLSNAADPYVDRARVVSFNRPFADGNGAGQFFRWEFQLLRWMEKNGYDVSYCTNHDLHRDEMLLKKTNVFLSVGHDEYWSKSMFDPLHNGLETKSLGVGFFGANAMYWQVRMEDSFNGKFRNMVCYKCDRLSPYLVDPIFEKDRTLVTARFRDFNVNRAEQQIIGQMYEGWFKANEPNKDLVIANTNHPLFENTGIEAGEKFHKLVGYEFDRIWDGFPKPPNVHVLAKSPVTWHPSDQDGIKTHANVTVYTLPTGNSVFSAGTCSWSWGLDDYGHIGEGLVHVKLQKWMQNILCFLAKEKERAFITGTVKMPVMQNENIGSRESVSIIASSKVVTNSWWVCGAIGLGIGLYEGGGMMGFAGFISGSVVGGIAGLIIDNRKAG